MAEPQGAVQALFVRCTAEPLSKLAEALYDFASRKQHLIHTPRGIRDLDLSPVLLGAKDGVAFVEDAGGNGSRLVKALSELASRYPRTLVLVIDQAEEILTLTQGDAGKEARDRFFDFVSQFSKEKFDLKLVLAIRSEYFGRFYNEFDVRKSNRDATSAFFLLEAHARRHRRGHPAPRRGTTYPRRSSPVRVSHTSSIASRTRMTWPPASPTTS